MPTKKSSSSKTTAKCVDFNDLIEHYQTINNEIHMKTVAAFEAVDQLASTCNTKEKDSSGEIISNKGQTQAKDDSINLSWERKPDQDIISKTKTIAELNSQIKTLQVELEAMTLKSKKLEAEKEECAQELSSLKESLKKIKVTMSSKQAQLDTQKNELRAFAEKIKAEENSRKNLHKDIERLTKEISSILSDKEKLDEKLQRCKADYLLYKQKKESENTGNQKIPLMLRCIRKQAILIENLLAQIAHLHSITGVELHSSSLSQPSV